MRDVVALVVRELQALENLDPGPDVVVVMLPRDVEFELAHVGAAMARRRTVLSPKDRFLTKLRKDEAKGQGFPHR